MKRVLGGRRSGMSVRLVGLETGVAVERRWTLLAEEGQGAWTPCLAAPLLAEWLRAGALAPGGRPPSA